MALLNGNNIKKEFLGNTIFENVYFNVYEADRIGFVGINGAGKSTLFKIITGEIECDLGDIIKSKDLKISYLDQYAVSDGNKTIIEEILDIFSEVIDIEKQLDEIHFNIEHCKGDIDSLILKQASLQERFMELNGLYYKSKIKSTLLGLGFTEDDFLLPINKLSGGQKTRIALCKVLLSNANLLLLDEPTNHLDTNSVEWLEDFLTNYKGAFIVISHDRYFLDKITTKTFVLENKHFRSYDGNYSSYIAQREIEKLTEQRNYDYTIKEIERLEEVVEQQRRWKHKKNKKTHTIDNTKKAIERLEKELVVPEKAPDTMHFKFKAYPGGAQKVLEMKNISMGFGTNMLFENINMEIKKGEKVFLLGPNGCGKTTLIKLIMNIYQQKFGDFKIGENIHIGYYDQLKENLHKEKKVINEIWDEYPTLTQTEIRNALALFLFKGDDVFKEIKTLSGGELARVEITKLLLKKVNFLIMDEPTNHLDIASREALESALIDYDGTMLVVSHDRYFINKLADKILYLTPNDIIKYDGNYDNFIALKNEENNNHSTEKTNDKSNDYKEKKLIQTQKRKLMNRCLKIENDIQELENEIKNLSLKLEDPIVSSNYELLCEIGNQMNQLQKNLDENIEEWEKIQQQIENSNF